MLFETFAKGKGKTMTKQDVPQVIGKYSVNPIGRPVPGQRAPGPPRDRSCGRHVFLGSTLPPFVTSCPRLCWHRPGTTADVGPPTGSTAGTRRRFQGLVPPLPHTPA